METGGRLGLVALAALAVLAGWLLLGAYVRENVDECAEGYRAARTAADTARVDSLAAHEGAGDAGTCGFWRSFYGRPVEEDSAQVHRIAAGLIAADNARDIVNVLGYYSDSAVLVPPGEQPVSGIREIQQRYVARFAGWQPAIESRIDQVLVSDSTATIRGHNGGWLRTLAAGQADRALDDDYVMTLERRGGVWQIHRLQWSRNTP